MKKLKQFLCWIGWHKPWPLGADGYIPADEYRGFNMAWLCPWCNAYGLFDSQGNFFTVQRPNEKT